MSVTRIFLIRHGATMLTAEDRFAELSARFPGLVGMAHGLQDLAVREAALADFAAGTTRLLVATTVVEVGVDVPEATIMLIEQAERFGLAALHQLRGRVGRGSKPSSCLLVHSEGLSDGEKRRLLVLRDTEDGFLIAEEDLRARGGGDVLRERQSGLQERLKRACSHSGLLRTPPTPIPLNATMPRLCGVWGWTVGPGGGMKDATCISCVHVISM
jgi:RecG-like helicase